jgi:cytochrome c
MRIERAVSSIVLLVLLVALVALPWAVLAQDTDTGQVNFMAYCAACHGADGKGSGPRSAGPNAHPANLTLLAKKNHGVFDSGAILQIIDGRQPGARAHLSQEMPIWGCRHASAPAAHRKLRKHQPYFPPAVTHKRETGSSVEALVDLPCDSEAVVQERLRSIVDYLSRIQQ